MRIRYGFTLAELLIALVILGVIATFTIPKVLQSQQDTRWKSSAKEVAGMIEGAFQAYKTSNTVTGNTRPLDLTPYMNYVRVDTSSTFDQEQGVAGGVTCDGGTFYCLDLHNGGVLDMMDTGLFQTTDSTSLIFFYFDPDGVYSGSGTGNGKSVVFWLHPNGRIETWGTIPANSYSYWGGASHARPADPTKDPPWFAWN